MSAMTGKTTVRGDFGNPTGTGYAVITVENLEDADAETAATSMDTFVDSLKSGGFTGCNVADTRITINVPQTAAKPGASVDIDDQLIVFFKDGTKAEKPRRLTISGIDPDSALLVEGDAGKRLSDAGKTTLAGYLDTLFGWTSQAVVLVGKFRTKY